MVSNSDLMMPENKQKKLVGNVRKLFDSTSKLFHDVFKSLIVLEREKKETETDVFVD
jgi:hypothetical protein